MKFMVLQYYQRIRNSFLPPSLALGFLVPLMTWVLIWAQPQWSGMGADSVRQLDEKSMIQVTGLLMGAMVTLTAIVFPITFSMVQQAMAQYSPAVLRVYHRLLSIKLLLGLVVGTTLGLLTLLTSLALELHSHPPTNAFLFLQVMMVALILTLPIIFSLFVQALEPGYVAETLSNEIQGQLESLEPRNGETDEAKHSVHQNREKLRDLDGCVAVPSDSSGYLESIDLCQLVKLTKDLKGLGKVGVRSGDFIYHGEPLLYIEGPQTLTEDQEVQLRSAFQLSKRRRGLSDLEIDLDQMVNICLRALSPSTNDLSTGVACIQRIGDMCHTVLNRPFYEGIHHDDCGRERLYTKEFDFAGFFHAAFDRIRQNAAPQPSISLCLLNVLAKLSQNCQIPQRRAAIVEIAEAVASSGQSDHPTTDKQKIELALNRVRNGQGVKL